MNTYRLLHPQLPGVLGRAGHGIEPVRGFGRRGRSFKR